MKFAITILILLAVASIGAIILGEIFPPGAPAGAEFFRSRLGETKYSIFKGLGFFNPYRSFWYVSLLGILSVSLTVCSVKRLGGILKIAFGKSFRASASEIRTLENSRAFTAEMSAEKSAELLGAVLRKRLYRVNTRSDGERRLIFARRGGVARLGFFFTHTGLVVALVGGLLTSLLGYSVYRWGGKGDIMTAPDGDFQVQVDKFEILYNEKGQVKDYLSTVTVLEDGERSFTKLIEVNRPLRFRGVNFYQSSYRSDARDFEEAVLAVRDSTGKVITMVKTKMGESITIPETPYTLQPVDFVGNFMMRGKEVFSDPRYKEFRNPAVKVGLYNNEELIQEGWIFSPELARFHPLLQEYGLELVNVKPVFQTGLQVTRNPGTPLIWIGLLVMTVGVCAAFYISHRRVWVVVSPAGGGKCHVALGGQSNRDKIAFRREIDQMAEKTQHACLAARARGTDRHKQGERS